MIVERIEMFFDPKQRSREPEKAVNSEPCDAIASLVFWSPFFPSRRINAVFWIKIFLQIVVIFFVLDETGPVMLGLGKSRDLGRAQS